MISWMIKGAIASDANIITAPQCVPSATKTRNVIEIDVTSDKDANKRSHDNIVQIGHKAHPSKSQRTKPPCVQAQGRSSVSVVNIPANSNAQGAYIYSTSAYHTTSFRWKAI
jgi:hypothetical protein